MLKQCIKNRPHAEDIAKYKRTCKKEDYIPLSERQNERTILILNKGEIY